MAGNSSDDKTRKLIDEFLCFTKQIGLEIVKEDIEIAIFLIEEKLPEENVLEIKKAKQPGVQLVSCLKKNRLLSENNLDFFIELLEECLRIDLANRVKEYRKTSVTTLKSAPPAQIIERIPAYNMESLFLVIAAQKSSITVSQLDNIRESISRALGLKISDVFYVATDEDEENPQYSQLRLQLPKREEKINQLQIDAVNKMPWLTDLEVVELTVDNKSSIKIAEKKKGDVPKKPKNGEKQSKPPLLRNHSVLGLDPSLKIHCNQMLDIVLAIELPSTVDVNKRRAVVGKFESAMNKYYSWHKELHSFRLAAIKFGNHTNVPVRQPNQQQIAFLVKELSNDLKMTASVKPEVHCGGIMNSGLADALSMVHSLKDDMHREATKLCIVICFITSNSANLEHYRCCFGYDVIDLGHALATDAVPLYIIGIDLEGRKTSPSQAPENYLLSGLTAITGGRYFQIQDISLLEELIHSIIEENNSIEKNMGTVNDVVIREINKQYGDVNDVHLTEYLYNTLRLRSCELDCITLRGTPLTPISQIAERVSWANNLDDAIAGVNSLKKHLKAADKGPIASKQVSPPSNAKGKRKCKSKKEPKEFVSIRKNPDMEVSARMVRRQIERSAYYRPTTEKY
ncbi:uncharacterized protein LOC116296380 [Actinia tenebrosa]|uniref:Uncharacterized protein LOC116296380 n=1 Tax=Actinia tenebrosa TaxID=6105 RepID=A0A6P8HY26_ACTTE|nr:uncharacterized protein LOC116296380 [Actinia tenebrosa]